MKVLELFCGTKSFSNLAEKRGHKVFTIDNNPKFKPDLCKNILDINIEDIPFKPDIIWASPPCTTFSVASIGKHWNKNNTAKTKEAELGIKIIKKTIKLIKKINPKFVFIENPRGKLRKLNLIPYKINTITYCQYGDKRMKPTDIWTNFIDWKPKNMCKNNDKCHQRSPRGARTGTQGLKNNIERGKIPRKLCLEILKICEK